jgi:hypothetical protein
MAVVVLCTVLGLVSVEVADVASRHGYSYGKASVFFWLGLLLIFVPIAVRVLMHDTDRLERLTLIVVLGVALYLVKILFSPDAFALTDEFIWLRNTQNILNIHRLFGFNPLLPTAAYYPGLAAVTAGLVDLTGLSPFTSAVLIIGAGRLLVSACFFLVAERVTGCDRAAAGASLVYAANPMFLFWSASFAYEIPALSLAAFVVWWFARARQGTGLAARIATVVAIVAVIVTHHVVGFALAALLGTWWLAERLTQRPSAARRDLGLMALVTGITTLAWFFFVARPAASYLFTNNILPALRQTGSLLLGHIAPRRLYASGGYTSPEWETVAGFAAVGLLLLALPLALYRAWPSRDRAPMVVAIVVAVAFPFSLVPRLAPIGVAISGRSAEYIFFGLGCLVGLLANEAASRRRGPHLRQRMRAALLGWRRTAMVTGLVTLVFIGGVTIGTAFYQQLPESSHPQGYPWTLQPDVINAAKWAREHLGINQPFGASWIDSLALATYGEQNPVAEESVWPIFFAKVMNASVEHDIRATKVRYLLVDWRMTKSVPATPGYYFSPQEPGAAHYRQSFPPAALKKFASAACAHLVYRSGPIEIFDVSRIENGSCVPMLASDPRHQGVPR